MHQEDAVLVVGGSGLVGRALQALVLNNHSEDTAVFSYATNRKKIREGLQSTRLDLSRHQDEEAFSHAPTAIYLAGTSDHAAAESDPAGELQRNAARFLNFMRSFKGRLVLLSSQAVYCNLSGAIGEETQHVAQTSYGFAKQVTEEYAKHFLRTGRLSSLWIIRLMYTFGEGERPSRLIPSCARAASGRGPVELRGGGTSLLNPLPASFVASVLLHAAQERMDDGAEPHVANLNSPEVTRVIDVIRYLSQVSHFEYVAEGEEKSPVRFWGDTERISNRLRRWGLEWPDPRMELKNYFGQLLGLAS